MDHEAKAATDRMKALYARDAKKLGKEIEGCSSEAEVRSVIKKWEIDEGFQPELSDWIANSFKLGHDSTGFQATIDFDTVDSEVLKWIEKRAATSADLQTDYVRNWISDHLQTYVKEGKPMSDFRKDIWDMIDNAGITDVKPYHVETIIRTEGQAALNRGRYVSMVDAKDLAPLWEFVYVDDGEHEEGTICYTVAKKGGLIMPATWSGWTSGYYPPTHFNCRSGVVAIPQSVIKRDGITKTGIAGIAKPDKDFVDKINVTE